MLPAWIDPRTGLVLDIGANEGDWTAAVLRVFPQTEVIAAEPGAEPRAVLAQRFAGTENVRIDPRAVSDLPGTASFYRTRASVFSSLHRPEPALHELYALPGGPTALIETVTVETVTLDDLVGDRAVSVLKLDVQGGELAVLRSGRRVLENTAAVLVEVLFLPHYEGDATFPDLHNTMTEIGFALIDLSAPFRLDGGPALWADACYARLPRA
jgi:FkbM family methyltransferase